MVARCGERKVKLYLMLRNFWGVIAFSQEMTINFRGCRIGQVVRLAVLALAFCVGWGGVASEQDAGKVVDEYVKAAGGKKALGKIQTSTLEGILAGRMERRGRLRWIPRCPTGFIRSW
jgi:hypothetical protein